MTGIGHVFYRHEPDSGFSNVSKFSQGASVKDVARVVFQKYRRKIMAPALVLNERLWRGCPLAFWTKEGTTKKGTTKKGTDLFSFALLGSV